jgi:hypothetical protein
MVSLAKVEEIEAHLKAIQVHILVAIYTRLAHACSAVFDRQKRGKKVPSSIKQKVASSSAFFV